jgi:hypothetical protein
MKPEDLIIGSFSLPRVSVRPLIPPPPSSNVSFPKAQHLSWQLVKSSWGISSGPLGTFRKPLEHVVREGEQHNLVLDQAYDYIATYGLTPLVNFAVLSTGTDQITPSTTGLTGEFRRTNRDQTGATGTRTITRISDGVYTVSLVREFLESEVAGRNITQWGFSPVGTSGNNLVVAEFFRDGQGNPVVITPESDQRLRLIYTYQFSIGPVVAVPSSIDITGLGTFLGKYVLTQSTGGTGGTYPDLVATEVAITGSVIDSGGGPQSSYRSVYLNSVRFPVSYSDTSASAVGILAYKWPGLQPYVQGSRTRKTNPVTFLSNEANGTIRTIGIGSPSGAGFRFVLDPGYDIVKDNLHKLTLGPFTVTWSP